ncbi:CheR family methyltransferase [Elstera litoralis]|uniref:CheR family methyltransferase n=1 Tax=Elstera litoralis TaxID=552518 RepID=UPI00069646CB|nr:CheR family methyltransferase [Elstera litoralis]
MTGGDAAQVSVTALIEARYGLSPRLQHDRLSAFFADRSPLARQLLADHLHAAPESDPVWQRLIEAMLVHETFFYRHNDQLSVVARYVLPALRQRAGGMPLQLWCAGCATGEEAYTLAFLLRDSGCAGKILASDLSAESVAEAVAGKYSWKPGLNSFRALPEAAWRYFEALPGEANRWRVVPEVRAQITFQTHNLMRPLTPALTADLISCRNTLIYFSDESRRHAEATLVAASKPGTVLLLGPAERLRYTNIFVPMTDAHPQILHWPAESGA